jgi:hypothetical protein
VLGLVLGDSGSDADHVVVHTVASISPAVMGVYTLGDFSRFASQDDSFEGEHKDILELLAVEAKLSALHIRSRRNTRK